MTAVQLPLIGIALSPPEDSSPYYNLNPEYSAAIRRAGGAPLALPLTNAKGDQVVFSILINDFLTSVSEINARIERILELLITT